MSDARPGRVSDHPPTIGVLFVCLGNICRSPLAKCIFTHQAQAASIRGRFLIDSCGTGSWHEGDGADPRSVAIAARHGLTLPHVARKLTPITDFQRFDYLLAMDRNNRDTMLKLGAPADRVFLMRSFDASIRGATDDSLDVPDPYYGGDEGFQIVYDMLWRASEGLLGHALGGSIARK